MPRKVSLPQLHPLDWMKAARHIVQAGRNRADMAMELTASDAFIAAM
jgi:hypothetical protein